MMSFAMDPWMHLVSWLSLIITRPQPRDLYQIWKETTEVQIPWNLHIISLPSWFSDYCQPRKWFWRTRSSWRSMRWFDWKFCYWSTLANAKGTRHILVMFYPHDLCMPIHYIISRGQRQRCHGTCGEDTKTSSEAWNLFCNSCGWHFFVPNLDTTIRLRFIT